MKYAQNAANAAKIILCFIAVIASGCGDTSSAKKNSKNLYKINFYSSNCRKQIKKSFGNKADMCSYAAYQTNFYSCATEDFRRLYYDKNCHNYSANGANTGAISTNSSNTSLYDYSQIGGPLPTNPKYSSDFDTEILEAEEALNSYYTVDSSGCIAKIKGTFDVVDLCVDMNDSGDVYEKDAPNPSGKVRIYEKDDVDQGGTVKLKPKTTPETTDETVRTEVKPKTDAEPAAKEASQTSDKSDNSDQQSAKSGTNVVYYNAQSLRYEEYTERKIPTLRITARIDTDSPIYGLKHKEPGVIKELALVNSNNSSCPLRAQLSTSSNTLIMTLLADSESTDSELVSCKTLFNSISNLKDFEVKFSQPLKMSNNVGYEQSFKFINQ